MATNPIALLSGYSLIIVLLVSACSKPDNTTEDTPPPAPVAYVLDAPSYFGEQNIPSDNPTTVQGVELGRYLFYDKRLSADNTISCSSCHQQQHAFTDGQQLSPGVGGRMGNRSSMSLANSGWFKHYMWDGAALTLEEQAALPLQNHNEMASVPAKVVAKLQNTDLYPDMFRLAFGSSTITDQNIYKALAQFQRTLVSSNSKFDRYLRREENLSSLERQGYELFRTHPISTIMPPIVGANCGDCHGSTGILSLDFFKNTGLDENPTDKGRGLITGNTYDNFKFKVPSLRNIALTAPYMHDGRFATLEQVLDHYNEHVQMNSPNIAPDMSATNDPSGVGPLSLTPSQKAAIVAFLHTLTDSSFITNPKYTSPF